MSKEIYFDNSATTKVRKEVIDVILSTFNENYGNPSSLHKKGIQAEKA
ncbi:MAG: cysteine desulfurase, partial [Thermosediminibacterales bacterium]|nr:cysteine desulfurase [Thermosediminibacterales bacterium]